MPHSAANLRLEYEEFFDKNTSRSSSSGAFVIHCPRCTRVVNATHGGVCGNCGEVVSMNIYIFYDPFENVLMENIF